MKKYNNTKVITAQPPKVRISNMRFSESRTLIKGKFYTAESLYDEVRILGLKPFNLPIAGIPIDYMPFDVKDLYEFVFQMKRVKNTDLNIPIVISNKGIILDGWHRVAKAMIQGKRTIKAYRLPYMPEKYTLEKDTTSNEK